MPAPKKAMPRALESDIPNWIVEAHSRACPRCGSTDVKFLSYNNKEQNNVGNTQPRYRCNTCLRQFTRGGRQYKKTGIGALAQPNGRAGRGARGAGVRVGGAAHQVKAAGRAAIAAKRVVRRALAVPTRPRSATAKRARGRPWPLWGSTSLETDTEGRDQFPVGQVTRAEARSAEDDEEEGEAEAEVQASEASEFEEGPVDSVSNIQMEVDDEPHEETIASQHGFSAIAAAEELAFVFSPEETDGAFHEQTPRWSTLSGGIRRVAPGLVLAPQDAKDLTVCEIRKHLIIVELFLGDITMELEALEADLSFRETQAVCRGRKRKLSTNEEFQKILRDQLVAAASAVKVDNGRVYECSLRRYNWLIARKGDMAAMDDELKALKSLFENMDVDHASLPDLLEIEGRVLRLEFEALKLNGD